ncbi:LLM class flavin-dependent oxidoreductase [Brevibacterium ravenspurgense]|uniref:LLM class flavin-dependent oxidoreductase n=1 Tax=Brevibacterium ravenspurgense TaxID=479117 RepID=UPI001EF39FA3|nr:LLM class flavin-dependent oxidoreductase [Brevibacterium ravenspurgense]MCG7300145.1 LLM class flavin-dependent oxidoreductase [Brevibacterium ravenspurgense]
MRYENPLYLAEEAAALDLLSDGRVALGISRGSPEPAERGWEAFGYAGSTDPRGADIAREKFPQFMAAIRGEGMVEPASQQSGFPPSPADEHGRLRIEPHSPGLDRRIWWGAGSRETAVWAAQQGVNLMSSTLLTEATGDSFAQLQSEQIALFRDAWKKAGHDWTPRVSVSRSIFPIVNELDAMYFGARGQGANDQIGVIDGFRSTFGKTYAAEPDQLVEQLKQDTALMDADSVMLAIPSQLGVDYNLHILEAFATHVAPELGWQPAWQGPTEGYPVS